VYKEQPPCFSLTAVLPDNPDDPGRNIFADISGLHAHKILSRVFLLLTVDVAFDLLVSDLEGLSASF